ncbi:hypothetical protein VTK73DRAFT_7824 [Phialemonium thermophilum]|uniref:HIT-type domain-containing protein n=1 Tax=Phialemonium thermophilum TaxID=223376 RepID=A0ABR3XRF2_9PEZI
MDPTQEVLETTSSTTATSPPSHEIAAVKSPASSQRAVSARVCGICNEADGKYKCPRCFMPYCSVACNRAHKENHPSDEVRQEQGPAEPRMGRHDDDPYRVLLEHSSEFKRLFMKYPDLEAELGRIQRTTLPPRDDNTPKNGLPWKLKSSGNKRKEPWSQEVGLRTGAAALRKARMDPGETGDGVREYCELVLHLLSTTGKSDATTFVRREVAVEETKTIQRLLSEEREHL